MKKEEWDAIRIESDVVVPKTKRQSGSLAAEKIKALSPGDSFVVPKKAAQNVINQFREVYGVNSYTSRTQADGSIRFWRK